MSNSREIMERRILLANGNYQIFEALHGLSVDFVMLSVDFVMLDDDIIMRDPCFPIEIECPDIASVHLPVQRQSFTPPHKKHRRSKFKRSGR